MHPVENIRATASAHLVGRRIVLAVCGSIGAVKAVELARELIRHGADVVPVMSEAATRILHPDALEFATGNKPITKLTGAVEHVALFGQVKDRADLLLVAPATANTVAKMALGIDDTPVTTCATVAFGNHVPVIIAPAMHEVMLEHPIVAEHQKVLVERLGVTWIEPLREEKKAKLADVEAITDAVIHRLAARDGPLAGQKCLVVAGSTQEPIDPVRVVTNRSSGRSGMHIALELHRLGADVTLWHGHGGVPVPPALEASTTEFDTVDDVLSFIDATDLAEFKQVWLPAALGDFAPVPADHKLSSDGPVTLEMRPLPKAVLAIRKAAPDAFLVAFKAESDPKTLLKRARDRLKRYGADAIVANLAASFGGTLTSAHLVTAKRTQEYSGPKALVLPAIVHDVVALAEAPRKRSKPKAR